MKTNLKLSTLLCVFTLLLSSCGGGGEEGTSTTNPSTTSEGGSSETTSNPSDSDTSVEETFTIIWNNYDGTELEKDLNVKKGVTPTYDGAAPTRANDGTYTYTWSGWDPAVTPASKDQTYTATYNKERITYTIKFDLNGGTSATYNGQPKTVTSLSKDDFFFDCVKSGWNFRGWSYNNEKVFDENGHQLANPEMAKEMTFVAIYAQTARLTIVKNIEEAGEVTGSGEYAYNTDVDISAKANDGYFFQGWYVENILVSAQENYKYRMWSSDVVIEARFLMSVNKLHIESNNPTHGLVHINNNEGGANAAEDNGYFSRGTQIQIVAFSLDETRYLGWFDDDNKLVSTGALYSFTMPDEEYNLEAKWNYFTIEYDLNEGINDERNEDHYTVEEVPTLYAPTREGYRFDGWKLDDEEETIVTAINPDWMRHIKLTATWGVDTYSITYILDGGTNDDKNPSSYTYFDVLEDSIPLYNASKTGYDFKGWYLKYEDGEFDYQVFEIEIGSTGDITLYAKFTPHVYTITYVLDGGTNSAQNPTTYTIESEITLKDATRNGYDFSGWYDASNNKVTKINKGTTGNLTLTANWEAKQYGLTVSVNDKTLGSVTIVQGSGRYNETIIVQATALKSNPFKGWYKSGTRVSSNLKYTFTMPMEAVSLTATFYTDQEVYSRSIGMTPVLKDSTTITYGLYPKTKITNSTMINTLENNAIESGSLYFYNNEFYKVRYWGGEESKTWFKCEPVEWTIIKQETNSYTLISKYVIGSYCFDDHNAAYTVDGKSVNPNNYYYSDIREYLNDDMYWDIFGKNRDYILDTTFETNNKTVTDKLYLPSKEQVYGEHKLSENILKSSLTDNASFTNPENCYMSRAAYGGDGTQIYTVYPSTGLTSGMNVTYTMGIRPLITLSANIPD